MICWHIFGKTFQQRNLDTDEQHRIFNLAFPPVDRGDNLQDVRREVVVIAHTRMCCLLSGHDLKLYAQYLEVWLTTWHHVYVYASSKFALNGELFRNLLGSGGRQGDVCDGTISYVAHCSC